MHLTQKQFYTAIAMASLGAVLFSGKAILIKLAYRFGTSAEVFLALRMAMAFPIFWLVYYFSKERQNQVPLSYQEIIKIACLGFCGYFLSSYVDFLALHYISVGLERIILYLTPAIVVLISYFYLKKEITKFQWLSMFVGYLGVVLAFIQDALINGQAAWIGMGLVFMSACLYSVYLIFAGEIVQKVGSIRLVTYASSFSAIFSILQMFFHGPQALFNQVAEVYFLSLINASTCTVIPMMLIMMSVKQVGSAMTSQAGILGPLSTIFMGWYLLGEAITLYQLIGLVLVVIAMWLLMKSQPSPQSA